MLLCKQGCRLSLAVTENAAMIGITLECLFELRTQGDTWS